MKKPIISIVICVYNGEHLLPTCLQSVLEQTASKEDFEVIIINNNSTDKTLEVAEKYVRENPNFKVFNEENVGLSYARNRGFHESAGDYVSYLDDDAKLAPDWVERALNIISAQQPDIFGGPIFPFYKTPKPQWFKDAFGSYNDYNKTGLLNANEFLSGSNIVFHITTFGKLGGFDVNFGMKGEELGYGEETALLLRARKEIPDVKIYYDYDLRVYHLVPEYKMQILYFLVNSFSSGRSWERLHRLTEGNTIMFKDLRNLLASINNIVSAGEHLYKLSQKGKLEDYEPFVLDMIVPAISHLGVLYERITANILFYKQRPQFHTRVNRRVRKLLGKEVIDPDS